MSQDSAALLHESARPRILIVGDVILDRYLWGNVERISPEAPIPLLRVVSQEDRLGGAGSVAAMLAALEAEVSLVSVVGDDPEGEQVRSLLAAINVDANDTLTLPGRPTTVKERLLGRAQSRHPQQMIRVDREDDSLLSDAQVEQLVDKISKKLPAHDLVLVSDYNKGACTGDLLPCLIDVARSNGIQVVADPTRGGDYRRYAGCACVTPNRLEASLASGISIETPNDGLKAAREILHFGVENVIVTLDRDGMVWTNRDGESGIFPVRPRQVYDITGAGDMVLSTIGYGLALKASYPQVIELANLAGGLEVQRVGAVPLSRADLLSEAQLQSCGHTNKLVSLNELQNDLSRRRAAGERIAMTNGCFDLLHPGHIGSLAEARRHGDCLVVGLNSDESVRRIKGEDRPIIDQVGRAAMLSALSSVDYVVLFDDESVAGLIEKVRPDVLVKSNEYQVSEVVGHKIVESYGGTIVLTEMTSQYSTTGLMEKILNSRQASLSREGE